MAVEAATLTVERSAIVRSRVFPMRYVTRRLLRIAPRSAPHVLDFNRTPRQRSGSGTLALRSLLLFFSRSALTAAGLVRTSVLVSVTFIFFYFLLCFFLFVRSARHEVSGARARALTSLLPLCWRRESGQPASDAGSLSSTRSRSQCNDEEIPHDGALQRS